jgi:hypothetical protein
MIWGDRVDRQPRARMTSERGLKSFYQHTIETSDHGEMWTDASMYMPDMIGEDGKSVLDKARMTEDQACRFQERRAGRSGTEAGTGRQET